MKESINPFLISKQKIPNKKEQRELSSEIDEKNRIYLEQMSGQEYEKAIAGTVLSFKEITRLKRFNKDDLDNYKWYIENKIKSLEFHICKKNTGDNTKHNGKKPEEILEIFYKINEKIQPWDPEKPKNAPRIIMPTMNKIRELIIEKNPNLANLKIEYFATLSDPRDELKIGVPLISPLDGEGADFYFKINGIRIAIDLKSFVETNESEKLKPATDIVIYKPNLDPSFFKNNPELRQKELVKELIDDMSKKVVSKFEEKLTQLKKVEDAKTEELGRLDKIKERMIKRMESK